MASKVKEHAKVPRIKRKHHKEIKTNAYIRRLDKIYSDLGKSPMLPRVVLKMRDQYGDDPHTFYKLVCQKYLLKPEKEFDAYQLVYGKTQFLDSELKQDDDGERVAIRTQWVDTKVGTGIPEEPLVKSEVKEEELSGSEKVSESSPKEQTLDNVAQPDSTGETLNIDIQSDTKVSELSVSKSQSSNVEYVNVHPGDVVETMVITGESGHRETGFWIPARILSINMKKKSMNVQVLQPVKYGVAETAANVPYRFIRSPSQVTWRR